MHFGFKKLDTFAGVFKNLRKFLFFFFVVSFATSFVLTGMQPWIWSSLILGLFKGETAVRCGCRCIATR